MVHIYHCYNTTGDSTNNAFGTLLLDVHSILLLELYVHIYIYILYFIYYIDYILYIVVDIDMFIGSRVRLWQWYIVDALLIHHQ